MLPTEQVAPNLLGDWSPGCPAMGETLIYNCYQGWGGQAILESSDRPSILLTAQGTGLLHFYRPPGARFCCLEPVTHAPDAINRTGGMEILQPGARRTIHVHIKLF